MHSRQAPLRTLNWLLVVMDLPVAHAPHNRLDEETHRLQHIGAHTGG